MTAWTSCRLRSNERWRGGEVNSSVNQATTRRIKVFVQLDVENRRPSEGLEEPRLHDEHWQGKKSSTGHSPPIQETNARAAAGEKALDRSGSGDGGRGREEIDGGRQ